LLQVLTSIIGFVENATPVVSIKARHHNVSPKWNADSTRHASTAHNRSTSDTARAGKSA